MSVLISPYLTRPENFHEVTGLRLIDIVEISTEAQLVKETRGARAIRVPAAPDAFSIVLVANDQALERGIIQIKLTALAQRLNRSDKHQIGRARTETRPRRNDKKLSRLKMC